MQWHRLDGGKGILPMTICWNETACDGFGIFRNSLRLGNSLDGGVSAWDGALLDNILSLCLSFFLIAFVRLGLRFGWLYIRAVFF
jgi:hypothetical protein